MLSGLASSILIIPMTAGLATVRFFGLLSPVSKLSDVLPSSDLDFVVSFFSWQFNGPTASSP